MKTKKTLFLLHLFLLLTLIVQAQGESSEDGDLNQIKSIINKNKEKTGFGSIDFKVGQALDNQVLLVGVHGGILSNKKVMLGVAGYGLVTNFDLDNKRLNGNQKLNLHGGYAGLLMGYVLAPKEIIHLSFPVILGAGHMEITDPDYYSEEYDTNFEQTIEKSGFLVLEPGMQLELNLSKNFRLGLGATYRLTRGLSLVNLTDNQMSGFMGMVSFQIGKF